MRWKNVLQCLLILAFLRAHCIERREMFAVNK
jgi:hypothetical protein